MRLPGGWEIALIVLAVILVFGVGKLSQVGGALGKSIREFRKEKEGKNDTPQLTSRDTSEDTIPKREAEYKEESKK